MVLYPCVVDENREGYLRRGIPAPHQTTQPRVPVPGRYIPINSGFKNQWGLGHQKELGGSGESPLKGPAVD